MIHQRPVRLGLSVLMCAYLMSQVKGGQDRNGGDAIVSDLASSARCFDFEFDGYDGHLVRVCQLLAFSLCMVWIHFCYE